MSCLLAFYEINIVFKLNKIQFNTSPAMYKDSANYTETQK